MFLHATCILFFSLNIMPRILFCVCVSTVIIISVAAQQSITLICHVSYTFLLLKANLMASFFTFINKRYFFKTHFSTWLSNNQVAFNKDNFKLCMFLNMLIKYQQALMVSFSVLTMHAPPSHNTNKRSSF